VLLLLAATAAAQDPLDVDEMRAVARLTERLGHNELSVRIDAQEKLMRFGRRALPVLREMTIASAEARLRVRAILDAFARVELTAELKTSQYALGTPVVVSLTLINHTNDTFLVPLEQGELTPFQITIGSRSRPLRRGEVEFVKPQSAKGFVTLGPGDGIHARSAIRAADLPRKRAGTYRLVVTYRSAQSLKVDVSAGANGLIQGDQSPLNLTSNQLAIDISTRSPAELELALSDPDHRMRALVELQLRDDESVLPLLRKYVKDPDVRLHAIKQLGSKGDLQDLATMRDATKDRDRAVRIAATLALGNFQAKKARQRLSTLARDAELRLYAIRALTKHKSARTIETYIRVLQGTYREGPWVPIIQNAIRQWTGIRVPNSVKEIKAFESWWTENRARWIEENK
jgi:hypothetical protein